MKTNSSQFTGQRGSALSTVLLMSTVAIILLGSYMKTAIFESKAIVSDDANDQAKRAAESLANYGAAQVIYHFHQDPLVALQEWTNRVLEVPGTVRDHITQGNFELTSFKVSVGPVMERFEPRFIDPMNSANLDDPLKGRQILVNTFYVYAEATVNTMGRSITRYAELPIQLRDASFFSNAIYYNMDMELMPENRMTINGPIYANGDLYLSAGSELNIEGSISAAGKLLHGVKLFDGDKYWRAMGNIDIANPFGEMVSMKRPNGSGRDDPQDWIDHHPDNAETWLEDATRAWGGLVMDRAHNIPKINLAGYKPYVPDNPATPENERMNHSYAFIEPVLPTSHRFYKGEQIRSEKIAWKAGLILKYDWYRGITAHTYKLNASGARVLDSEGNAELVEVKLPAGLIGDANYKMDAIESDAVIEPFRRLYKQTYKTVEVPVYETEIQYTDHSVVEEIAAIESQYGSMVEYYSSLGASDNVIDSSSETPDPEVLAAEWVETQKNTVYAKDPDSDGWYTTSEELYVTDTAGENVQATDAEGNLLFSSKSVLDIYYHLVESGFYDFRQGWSSSSKSMQAIYLDVDRLRQLISDGDTDYSPEAWSVDYTESQPAPDQTPADLIAVMDQYAYNFDDEWDWYEGWTYDSSQWQEWDFEDWQYAIWWTEEGWYESDAYTEYVERYDVAMHELYYSKKYTSWNHTAYVEARDQAREIAGYDEWRAEKDALFAALSNWVAVVNHLLRPNLPAFDPGHDWNGIVYFEYPYNDFFLAPQNEKLVRTSSSWTGLVLINGQDLPTRNNGPHGFSFATNLPLYLVGSYNADGDLSTGSATDYESGEVPAMLAADTFTVLSLDFADKAPIPATDEERTNFRPTGRRQSPLTTDYALSYRSYLYADQPVEISAGLIAGITPTIPMQYSSTVKQSGGVHNLIRYMQHWGRDSNNPTKVLFRGSMVVLYENMVHTHPIGTDYKKYYYPPERTIGYNRLFKEGKFPPGTPKGRSYRKESLTFPTFEEYYQKTKNIPQMLM